MDIIEEAKAIFEEKDFFSDGQKIAYAIDHFGLSIEELQKMSDKSELAPTSIVEMLIAQEEREGSADKAVDFFRNYSEEIAADNIRNTYEEYMSGSNEGYYQAFNDYIEDSKNIAYVKTGFQQLDKILEGGLHEGLYVVGAIPSLGKTTWVTQISDNMAFYGNDVLFFSLEMSRFDLMARSISRLTARRYKDLGEHQYSDFKTARGIIDGKRYEGYSEREQKVIAFAKNAYANFAKRIRVIEGSGDVGIKDIREAVETHLRITHRTPAVVIDYLQLIAPFDPKLSDKQNMDKATLELKRIARDFKTPVLAISSFNRSNYNTKVSFGSFKESGAIEYCADVVIGLQLEGVGEADFDVDVAKQQSPRHVEALVLKNRFGKTGETIKYDYFPAHNYFREEPKKFE